MGMDIIADAVVDVVVENQKEDVEADVASNAEGDDTTTRMETALILAHSLKPPDQTAKLQPHLQT